MRPVQIPDYLNRYITGVIDPAEVKKAYQKLRKTGPAEVTISIPAYNEELTIVQTLCSLADNITDRAVEILVVNNNSKDRTEELVLACGVNCIRENTQGITVSRNTGLANATGTYVLNADGDTVYPAYWIEEMIEPLAASNEYAITYGRFSFIPIANTGRLTYFFYEYIADFTRVYNTYFKTEAVNVYGFNSGFRRAQGLQVDGFNHPPGTNEDGWLALKLKNKGFGKLCKVTSKRAIVWTTDRRIQIDGGLGKAVWKRLKRIFS